MKKHCLSVFAFLFLTAALSAADWPQWRGPERTGISTETGLLKQWPKDGPPLLWKATDVGNGYSTPSIAQGCVYLLSNRGDKEYAIALDAKNGKQVWTIPIGNRRDGFGRRFPLRHERNVSRVPGVCYREG